MFEVFVDVFHEDIKLFLEHGFDNELFVMSEKEKAAGFTCRLTSFLRGLKVLLWFEGLLDHSVCYSIFLSKFCKIFVCIIINFDIFIDFQNIL
jgi:hypothetical protein